jgi:hypothetical protein
MTNPVLTGMKVAEAALAVNAARAAYRGHYLYGDRHQSSVREVADGYEFDALLKTLRHAKAREVAAWGAHVAACRGN